MFSVLKVGVLRSCEFLSLIQKIGNIFQYSLLSYAFCFPLSRGQVIGYKQRSILSNLCKTRLFLPGFQGRGRLLPLSTYSRNYVRFVYIIQFDLRRMFFSSFFFFRRVYLRIQCCSISLIFRLICSPFSLSPCLLRISVIFHLIYFQVGGHALLYMLNFRHWPGQNDA